MRSKTIEYIVYTLCALVVISTMVGILNNDIFQDGEWINAQWLGQDIVSLLLATPILILAQNKSSAVFRWQWKLVLAGVLFYFVYAYSFYLFGAELTWLYLLHLPIFSIALAGLLFVLYDLFNLEYAIKSKHNSIKPIIIAYLSVLVIMLTALWSSDILLHLLSEDYASDTPTGKAPTLIYSLDLGVVIPLMILSIIGYWKQKQYGIILTGLMLVKSSTLGFALMAMSTSLYLQGLDQNLELSILWCFLGFGGTVLTILFFKNNRMIIPRLLMKNNITIELMEYHSN